MVLRQVDRYCIYPALKLCASAKACTADHPNDREVNNGYQTFAFTPHGVSMLGYGTSIRGRPQP